MVHCSDTTEGQQGVDATQIRRWHIQERGWKDIGYHFVIKRDGTLQSGRPEWALGAGVEGHNWYTMHVCLVGGRDTNRDPKDDFTPEQFDALAVLITSLRIRYPLEVKGHTDFPGVTKLCPAFDLAAFLKERGL